jgi:hypothetical protein
MYWLWGLLGFLPLIAFFVWMQLWLFRPNRDFHDEIHASLIETRIAKDRFDVVGRLHNHGSHAWTRILVEAESYDKDGRFLDEVALYFYLTLSPGSEENIRLSFANPDAKILDESSKVVLKVTAADVDRF